MKTGHNVYPFPRSGLWENSLDQISWRNIVKRAILSLFSLFSVTRKPNHSYSKGKDFPASLLKFFPNKAVPDSGESNSTLFCMVIQPGQESTESRTFIVNFMKL